MKRVDQEIVLAAQSLGAGPWDTFRKAYFPQIKASILNAALLVFVLSSGMFVAPVLLGGPSDMMLGTVMHSDLVTDFEAGPARASVSGAVLTIMLILFASACILLSGKPYRRRRRSP